MAIVSKKTISLFPADMARINTFAPNVHGNTESLSGRVQEMTRDLSCCLNRTQLEIEHMNIFSESEWNYFRDALNGSIASPEVTSYEVHLLIHIQDADRLDGLGEKWSVDAELLSKKIMDLTEFQAYAVTKMVDAWWELQD